MTSWTFSGIAIEVNSNSLIFRAKSSSTKILLGGAERIIDLANLRAIEFQDPSKFVNGSLTFSDDFMYSNIKFKPSEFENAKNCFSSLTDLLPATLNKPRAKKSWTAVAERNLQSQNSKSSSPPRSGVTYSAETSTVVEENQGAEKAEKETKRANTKAELTEKAEQRKTENKLAREASKAEYAARAAQRKADYKNAREAAKAESAKRKADREAEKAKARADHLEKYGNVVADEVCGGKRVWIYSKGFVAVGVFSPGTPERLLGINGSADVAKKTAIGRGAVAVLTGGANLVLTPNKRGDIYLSITTPTRTHMIHMSPPTERDMKAMHKLQGSGQALIERLQNESLISATRTAPPAQQPQQVHSSPSALNVEDLGSQLEKLLALHKAGALDDAEFKAAKAKLIGGK